ncbi:DNA repair protein rad51c [Mortierella sp. AD094]|nr:DNA repair protein rad51c [Mortierella sp. AD094]
MAASRPSVTLRLSAGLRDKVIRSGYVTVADLCAIPLEDLASELKINEEQARELAHHLHPASSQALEQEKKWTPITTSCAALDRLFGGGQGIPPGKITEVCGLSGSGKTQLGLQLCINSQIPCAVGGAGGNSIFIDTEGSFVAKRAAQIAAASSRNLDLLEKSPENRMTTDKLMQGIQYCRVHSPMELIAMVRMLDGIVQAHPKTKLIVVDSIAFLFRSNFSDMNVRTKLVATLGRQLAAVARKYDIAVVVMNQMSTKIESHNDQRMRQGSERASGMVQPALGETWASVCTHRIRLYSHGDGQRSARLFKSPSIQEQCVQFQIVNGGISDVRDTLPQVVSIPVGEDSELGLGLEETIFHWEPIDLL